MYEFSGEKIFIDVGSSTTKVYHSQKPGSVKLLFTKSISFKEGFDLKTGISEERRSELVALLEELKDKHPNIPIRIYATAVFRKLLPAAKKELVDSIFSETGVYFNIINQELENYYLEVALVGKYKKDDPIMLVNIGGGSTELVILYGKRVIERHNLDLGIATIINKFPGVNKSISATSLSKVVEFTKKHLPVLKNKTKLAIYNGGELNYMRLVGYKLRKNKIFKDRKHPSLIHIKDYSNENEEVFKKIKIEELRKLMPNDPNWMYGARPCSAIAQAIFENYGIGIIIPSDSNLIDGVIRQDLRSVTLSGSFKKHLNYILDIRKYLIARNITVHSPRFTEPKNPGGEFVVFTGEEGLSPLKLERHHLDSIEKSDALIVCDPKGYVGASALIEIGYAQSLGKRIIFMEQPEEFMLNILPSEVGL